MRIDPLTGEEYDADRYYRGEHGLWHDREAEARMMDARCRYLREKRDSLNARRVARGLRKRSEKSFSRSAQRYHDYLKADSSFTFKEWLQNGLYKEYER